MQWFVYIMSNANHTLYAGMTNDLMRRAEQHKKGTYDNAFTKRYNFDRMVYFEAAHDKRGAAKREKQIKSWPRARKIELIESMNPSWRDMSVSWKDVLG
jgi:putative endonuclease